MSSYPPNVLVVAREMFAEANELDARAATLPGWRWLKRHNLRYKADAIRKGTTLFMMSYDADRRCCS